MKQALPLGVRRIPLHMHHDERGWFTEIFREAWDIGVQPVQWNMVFSQPGTLRGVHVHLDHYDYLIVPQGEMVLGLKDLRRASPTYGLSALCTLSEANLESYLIPPGVGHGFYFPVASLHCYAVSAYWNKADEMGCRWDDAGLGLAWPVTTPTLSDQDRAAPSLEALMARLHQHDFPRFW